MRSGSESSTALSDTLTLSPFSDSSLKSELTSDELPDLGAFTAVFHTLNNLQPVPRSNLHVSDSPNPLSRPSSESVQPDSTRPIPPSSINSMTSYLLANTDDLSPSPELPVSHPSSSLLSPFILSARQTQSALSLDDLNDLAHDDYLSDTSSQSFYSAPPFGSTKGDLIQLDSDDDGVFELDPDIASHTSSELPNLGQLDEALSFLADERAKWVAHRSQIEKQTKEPGKRRRRRRRPSAKGSSHTPRGAATDVEAADDEAIAGGRSSSASSHPQDPSDDLSSPAKPLPAPNLSRREKRQFKQFAVGMPLRISPTNDRTNPPNTTTTLVPSGKGKGRAALHHSRSTPQLRTKPVKITNATLQTSELVERHPNPSVEKLRQLTRKLIKLFPGDKQRLGDLLSGVCGRLYGITLPSPAIPLPIPGPRLHVVNDLDMQGEEASSLADCIFIDVRGPSPSAPSPTKRLTPSGKGKNKQKPKVNKAKEKEDSPERLVHVFIDHSNILIGLLSWLKRHPKKLANLPLPPLPAHQRSQSSSAPLASLQSIHSTLNYPSTTIVNNSGLPSSMPSSSSTQTQLPSFGSTLFSSDSTSQRPLKPTNHLSHAALALILERGRPITRRVMVTSSPLYQPMESAESLGYEVRIFMRVPDFGDGMDRIAAKSGSHGRSASLGSAAIQQPSILSSPPGKIRGDFPPTLKDPKWVSNNSSDVSSPQNVKKTRSQKRKGDIGSASTDGEVVPAPPSTPPKQTSVGLVSPSTGVPSTPQRIKYREQGVDELLQLKLHQAIASADELPHPLPPGSTIVLATGDGNVGQFNEDGFLGSVRSALRRGWEVELYAWEVGLSKRWAKEFKKGGEYEGRFRVIGMEQFGEDLVERSWW